MSTTARYVTATGTDTYANSTNPATPMSMATDLANSTAGDIVYYKKGTYTLGANFTPTNAGTVSQPVQRVGYNVTPGDLDTGQRSALTLGIDATNMPVIACGASFKAVFTNTYHIFRNFSVTGSQNATLLDATSGRCIFQNCKAVTSGNSNSTGTIGMGAGGLVVDCEAECTNAGAVYALNLYGTGARAIGCRIKDATNTYAAVWMSTGTSLVGSIVIAPTKDGIMFKSTTDYNLVYACDVYAPNGNACVNIDNIAAVDIPAVVNCTLTDSNRAFDNLNSATSSRPIFMYFNRTRDNANANVGVGDWPEFGAVTTDTGGPTQDFGDLTGDTDYRLQAGSACIGAGHLPNLDIGALQKQSSSAGLLVHPGMAGGMRG